MKYNAADGLEEKCFAQIGIFGPTYPPRLPTELTMPIPAAAAVPAKNAEGNGQNNGMDPITPSVPTDKKTIANTGFDAKTPLKIKPAAPTTTFAT